MTGEAPCILLAFAFSHNSLSLCLSKKTLTHTRPTLFPALEICAMPLRAKSGKKTEFEVIVQEIVHGLYHLEAGIRYASTKKLVSFAISKVSF